MKNFNFGENLRSMRVIRGISQIAMAVKIGISQPQYSRIERRKTAPSLEMIFKIAAVLDVPPADLTSPSQDPMLTAVNPSQKKSITVITSGGRIAYAILLIVASYDWTIAWAHELKIEALLSQVALGTFFLLAAFFIYYYTVKETTDRIRTELSHELSQQK